MSVLEPVTNGNGTHRYPSALDRIREIREEAPKDTLDLEVPGYGVPSLIGVRYRALDPDLDDFDSLVKKSETEGALDGLITACECVLMRNDDGDLEPLTTQGVPVRFDETLSDMMGLGVSIEAGGARAVLLKVFDRMPSPKIAALDHAGKLGEWMTTGRTPDEASLGEF
jgi:hypothetical protein